MDDKEVNKYEIENVKLLEKLKFWLFFNCLILSAVCIYQTYGVVFQGKMLTYKAPKLYSDTEFLKEEFWNAYDIVLEDKKCFPVLKTMEERYASR